MWMNRLQTILQTLRDRGLWQPLLVTLAFLFLLWIIDLRVQKSNIYVEFGKFKSTFDAQIIY